MHWILIALALMLGGCVTNGDFGRVRPELVSDDIHDWVGRDAVRRVGGKPSEFPLTDDERSLRDLAFALIEPPYNRNRWDSVWREYGFGQPPPGVDPFDPGAYLAELDRTYRRSEASAYARIVTDARNDDDRLQPFFFTAARVIEADRTRAQSLVYVHNADGYALANASRRNNENRAVVAWVCGALHQRVSSYRYAFERLVVAVPSSAAVEAERTINLLQRDLAQYCGGVGAIIAVRD